jgi:hypothetical protein
VAALEDVAEVGRLQGLLAQQDTEGEETARLKAVVTALEVEAVETQGVLESLRAERAQLVAGHQEAVVQAREAQGSLAAGGGPVWIEHDFRRVGSLGLKLREEKSGNQQVCVMSLHADHPAHPELQGKIHPGMVLCTVAGKDVRGLSMNPAVAHIEDAGRPCTLTLCLPDVLRTCEGRQDGEKLQIQAVVDALTAEGRRLRQECDAFRLLTEAAQKDAVGNVSAEECEALSSRHRIEVGELEGIMAQMEQAPPHIHSMANMGHSQ